MVNVAPMDRLTAAKIASTAETMQVIRVMSEVHCGISPLPATTALYRFAEGADSAEDAVAAISSAAADVVADAGRRGMYRSEVMSTIQSRMTRVMSP